MIHGFAHAALYTDKFEETLTFYREAFDAAEAGRFQSERAAAWLRIGDDILEIFESDPMPAEGAFKHIALLCDSVDAAYEKALRHGAAPHMAPKDILLDIDGGTPLRIAFVKGVNGEQIELCEHR